MMGLKGKWMFHRTLAMAGIGLVVSLNGCSPSPQVSPSQLGPSQPVSDSVWQNILVAAKIGSSASMYKLKFDVSISQGGTSSDLTGYGNVQLPNRLWLMMVESGNSAQLYQQGSAAYAYDNGSWSQATPLKSVNLYQTYMSLIQAAQGQHIPLVQRNKQYVIDEYCSVYQAIIPSWLISSHPLWPGITDQEQGAALYTFYVGQQDHVLREVTTSSAVSQAPIGSMQVNSDLEMFGIGNSTSQVLLPPALINQLENRHP
ncbi:hypothetical protein D2Q93_00740 [Alicyclobacillaceae bacterium I2511]|nr:hypothetical protein D2Q93_00740 [Alicyclobacillaceae bacterium I2511]